MVSADVNILLSQPTIPYIARELSAMRTRLNDVLATRPLEVRHFVEISAIFNNVSYIFLYLESNAVEFDVLLPLREQFFNDESLDDQLLTKLSGLSFADDDLEKSRDAFVNFLKAKRRAHLELSADAIAGGLSQAKKILGDIAADLATFLKSLNVTTVGARPDAAFYALASQTNNPAIRRKLHSAWRRVRDKRQDDLAVALDTVVRARWNEARCQGHSTVARRTFEKCGVSVEQAQAFLDSYLARAIASQRELCEIIRGTTVPNGASMDDFGYHLAKRFNGDTVPMLPLEACLDFALDVARRVFGIEFERTDEDGDNLVHVDVLKEGRRAGRIHFDLWVDQSHVKDANFTRGLRNRMAWKTLEQVPVAHVSCRFRHADDRRKILNFQNVHSLFHEFGHALNHLFIKRRMPNQSGLEYLPIERLEILSMWFEKWIYHPQFAGYVDEAGTDPRHLALAQEIKMLEYRRTHLDRAVTSAIDLLIHEQPALGVKEAFCRLDERFGIDEWCDLGAILPGFTWPMMQSNPGAYFAYLWGAAKSAEMFAPFLASAFEDIPADRSAWGTLAECFDFDSPSTAPDAESAFTFYGG